MPARSTLWVPPSAREKTYDCGICGAKLTEREYEPHMKTCMHNHREELDEIAAAHRERNPLERAIDREALDFQLKKYGRG